MNSKIGQFGRCIRLQLSTAFGKIKVKDDQNTPSYVTRITDGCSTFFQHVYLFLIPYIPAGFAALVPVMARQRNASSVHVNT